MSAGFGYARGKQDLPQPIEDTLEALRAVLIQQNHDLVVVAVPEAGGPPFVKSVLYSEPGLDVPVVLEQEAARLRQEIFRHQAGGESAFVAVDREGGDVGF